MEKEIKCKGCGKKVVWNSSGYGWCCVQHWKTNKKEDNLLIKIKWFTWGVASGILFAIIMVLIRYY